jgi:hypothetical protein
MTPSTAKAADAPGGYSRALGLEICDRTAAGGAPRTLRSSPLNVLQRDLRAWLDGDPEFAALFGLACAAGVTPLRYSLRRAADFCGRIAAGAPMSEACGAEGMPSLATVQWWTQRRPEFAAMLAAARASARLETETRARIDALNRLEDAHAPLDPDRLFELRRADRGLCEPPGGPACRPAAADAPAGGGGALRGLRPAAGGDPGRP